MSIKWPVKWVVLSDAYAGVRTNKSSGRPAKHYKCAQCGDVFPAKEVQVDHIQPVIPISGFVSWDETIKRMLCEKDGLQVLCKSCHHKKSLEERALAKQHKNNNKVNNDD